MRNYLSYMRQLTGKSARLAGVSFDKEAVNKIEEKPAEPPKTETEDKAEESKA